MSTPKYTAEGVKVRNIGNRWHCGNCGGFIIDSYGFASAGLRCPACNHHNRPDFSEDLASERIARLAARMETYAEKHDLASVYDFADMLSSMVHEVQDMEKNERIMFNYKSEPVGPSLLVAGGPV